MNFFFCFGIINKKERKKQKVLGVGTSTACTVAIDKLRETTISCLHSKFGCLHNTSNKVWFQTRLKHKVPTTNRKMVLVLCHGSDMRI